MVKKDTRSDKFRKILLDHKERILNSQIMESREDLEVSTDDLADESDLASTLISQSVSTNIRDREVSDLKAIEEALLRLNEGEFFDCEECGDPIEEKRLQALPTTKLCIACAEESEHEKKMFA